MQVSSFEERSLNPSKVIALTTKLSRGGGGGGGGGRGGRGGCVADENIIFPETCVSRAYNYINALCFQRIVKSRATCQHYCRTDYQISALLKYNFTHAVQLYFVLYFLDPSWRGTLTSYHW